MTVKRYQHQCRHKFRTIYVLIAGILAGCAGLENTRTEQSVTDSLHRTQETKACANHFATMDKITKNIADAEAKRIPGFPYLRINRFLASYDPKHLTSDAFIQWLKRLRRLDQQARIIEFKNLPDNSQAQNKNLFKLLMRCADLLMASDFKQRHLKEILLMSYRVPDAYNRWAQIVGLYPLSVIPVRFGIMHLQNSQRADFKKTTTPKILKSYAPKSTQPYDPRAIKSILNKTKKDALGIPLYEDDDRKALFEMFAPIIEVATKSNDDKPGRVTYDDAGKLYIDTKHPVIYRRMAFTRFHGRILTQLVYTVWFPARTAQSSFDIFAGKLDGIVWRVTLGHLGNPIAYDAIHPCGCYHLFFPVEPWSIADAKQHGFNGEPPVAPVPGPALQTGQRIHLRLKSATHYLAGVQARHDHPDKSQRYHLADENELRSLAHPLGRKSLYGPDGLIDESVRPERFLLWPMGVASAGAMRQWGHHATAFIGTRHFDDANLFEKILTRKH